jgi:hypothetical protein
MGLEDWLGRTITFKSSPYSSHDNFAPVLCGVGELSVRFFFPLKSVDGEARGQLPEESGVDPSGQGCGDAGLVPGCGAGIVTVLDGQLPEESGVDPSGQGCGDAGLVPGCGAGIVTVLDGQLPEESGVDPSGQVEARGIAGGAAGCEVDISPFGCGHLPEASNEEPSGQKNSPGVGAASPWGGRWETEGILLVLALSFEFITSPAAPLFWGMEQLPEESGVEPSGQVATDRRAGAPSPPLLWREERAWTILPANDDDDNDDDTSRITNISPIIYCTFTFISPSFQYGMMSASFKYQRENRNQNQSHRD